MTNGFYNTETETEKLLFTKGEDTILELPWNADTRYDGPQCSAIEDGFIEKAKKYNNNFIHMANVFNQYLFDTYHIAGVDLEFLFYLVFSADAYGFKNGAEIVANIMKDTLFGESDHPIDHDEELKND